MRSGELAYQAGVNLETLRFYENKGVLPPPKKSEKGYRQYEPKDLNRMIFISKAKNLGFTLREIKNLLAISEGGDTTCGDVKEETEKKIKDIREKIESLKKMEKALMSLHDMCAPILAEKNCALVECLTSEEGGTKRC